MRSAACLVVAACAILGCARDGTDGSKPARQSKPLSAEAGFVVVPPRDVVVRGRDVHIDATARLFYNLRPADDHPEDKPIFVLFNGFAAEIVRAYGTGPTTVVEGGAVVANPSSWTKMGNLVYIEPRQAGYSYDVVDGRAPDADRDCTSSIFNEYVDAADVLLGVFAFLDAHPTMHGPVFWVGESYAGVRVTWILAMLRGRLDLVPYADATLARQIASHASRAGSRSLFAGQILLEPWLAGGAQTAAIDDVCLDPREIDAVSTSLGAPCALANACACASAADRSLYDYEYSVERETKREDEASSAHVDLGRAAALFGVLLTAIDLLSASERSRGFKCSGPDETVPSEDGIVAELGALPAGQRYWLPYSPLQPGKELAPTTLDWRTVGWEASAFVDNLRDVPAFVTSGALDLVVPTRSLAPALRAVIGADRIDDSKPTQIDVRLSDVSRSITIAPYLNAGHMISMAAPDALARDVKTWLGRPP